MLDSQRDGIVQITQSLQQYNDLDAIHILSHGDIGELSLGNSKLNQNTLNNYADNLTNWANAIADHGDILLYGCNVAADLAGVEFVQALSQYTAADILASTDLTGSASLGGDWDLEYAIGDIEAELILNTEIKNSYQYVLNDFFTGDIPIFDNGTVFRDFPTDVTLPGSNFPSAPARLQLNRVIDAPNIDFTPFDPSIIGNGNFRIDYTPLDLRFIDSQFNPDRSLVNFSQAENQPFSLNFANGNFSLLENAPNYNYDKPKINSLVFPFDANSLNFNPSNFEFTSVSLNEFNTFDADDDSITFKFNAGTFDFSSLTSRNSLPFQFTSNVADFYDVEYDNIVRFGNSVTFDATGVTFRSDSITFDYQPRSLNFNPGSFAANANLYEYKLSARDFNTGVTLEQFNASDYRALDYAFNGDELFDSNYYINREGSPNGTNPFTDYIENGYQAGKNPNGLFDVDYYLDNNPDVRLNGGDPLTHYATFGGGEIFDSRDPNSLFDSSYYLASNPDVAAAGVNPLLHYIQSGWRESRVDNPGGFNPNRDPSPFFDTSFYFETHVDVRDASFELSSANPVQHMLEFGVAESRTTHKIFKSENVFKFSKVITPDSNPQEISNVKEDFSKINFDFTTKEDGTFEISQMSPVDDLLNPYTAAAVTFTILVGGTLFLRNQFDNSEDDTDWEALFNEDFANNTNSSAISGITIIPEGTSSTDVASISYGDPSLEDLLSGTRAFPGQEESERLVEIFTTPEVDGVEDSTIFPEEGIFLPTTTGFPKGDPIIEDLLNDGLFIGAEEEPQGTYVLTSTRDGDIIGYNPKLLGNSLDEDWDSRLTKQRLELDLTQDSSIGQKVVIPGRTLNDPTHGLFYDPNGNTTQLRSGTIRSSAATKTIRELELQFSGNLPREIEISFDHAEGNAASIIRQFNLSSGTIVINNQNGPCSFCAGFFEDGKLGGISQILNSGQILEVIYILNDGQTLIKDTFTGGKIFNPDTDREIETPFF